MKPQDANWTERRASMRRESDRLMPVTIECRPETLVKLQEKAQQRGQTLDSYLCDLMEREADQ